jgi:hypothetical protein
VSVFAVPHRTRRLAAGLLTAMAVASLAACGSNDSASGSSSTGTGTGAGDNRGGRGGQMAAYIQCLAQNGVTITMPSGGPNGAGLPSGGPNGAGLPSGGPNGGGTPPSGAPDGAGFPSGAPDASGGPGGRRARELTKPAGVSDATWAKATAACAGQNPTGGGNGSTATSSN